MKDEKRPEETPLSSLPQTPQPQFSRHETLTRIYSFLFVLFVYKWLFYSRRSRAQSSSKGVPLQEEY